MAVTTSKFSELSMLLLYVCYFSVYKETEFEFSRECFQGWGNFLLLGTYLLLSEVLSSSPVSSVRNLKIPMW